MKPFNLESALAGAKVVTRNGNKVKIGCYNKDYNSLLGWVDRVAYTWNGSGKSGRSDDTEELFMAPTERKEWVVVYGIPNDRRYTAGPFNSDIGANVFVQTLSSEYKATIHEILIVE